jgi:N-acetyl sugar amidotransferase
MNKKEISCKRCVMDTTDKTIKFDKNGFCTNCNEFFRKNQNIPLEEERIKKFNQIVNLIKRSQKGRKYDCIIGVSGGVDSSYLAYIVKNAGLNPLAVHLDNGWNSEIAASNIRKLVQKLDIDFYTQVINWEEFKDLQRAYLKASVLDVEAITDHTIAATLYKLAAKHKIKYIVGGGKYCYRRNNSKIMDF